MLANRVFNRYTKGEVAGMPQVCPLPKADLARLSAGFI